MLHRSTDTLDSRRSYKPNSSFFLFRSFFFFFYVFLPSHRYAIVSGVQKGVILSRDPDRVVHTQTLGEVNPGIQGGEDYIIITNFDFFWHDIREFFDPTGGKMGLRVTGYGLRIKSKSRDRMRAKDSTTEMNDC